MRLLITFIISLYFLLWGGDAYKNQDRIAYAWKSIFNKAVQTCYSGEQADEIKVSKAPASNTGDKPNDAIVATEIEEDNGEPRKPSGTSNCHITFLCARIPMGYYRYLKNHLPLCEHFSWSSSYKFIIHRVIRI